MHFICRAQNETHSEMVEKMRFELTTPHVANVMLYQLSYFPRG